MANQSPAAPIPHPDEVAGLHSGRMLQESVSSASRSHAPCAATELDDGERAMSSPVIP
jgi:hypothetical protein